MVKRKVSQNEIMDALKVIDLGMAPTTFIAYRKNGVIPEPDLILPIKGSRTYFYKYSTARSIMTKLVNMYNYPTTGEEIITALEYVLNKAQLVNKQYLARK